MINSVLLALIWVCIGAITYGLIRHRRTRKVWFWYLASGILWLTYGIRTAEHWGLPWAAVTGVLAGLMFVNAVTGFVDWVEDKEIRK